MNSITIRRGDTTLGYKSWLFPDGALGVRLDTNNHRFQHDNGTISIIARIKSSEDVMELIMITDALRGWLNARIRLTLPCCPYARQDRRCVKGEAFSLKTFAGLINAQDYESVTVFDPHSDVLPAVLDRVKIIDRQTILGRFDALNAHIVKNRPLFVSPDAGANKGVAALMARTISRSPILRRTHYD